MNDDPIDTITVTEEHFEDIRSEGADVAIAVWEWSFGSRSTGGIAHLREALVAQGLTAADISLVNVERMQWAWVLMVVGMAASFALMVARQPLAAIAALVGGVLLWATLRVSRAGTVTATFKVRCTDDGRVGPLLERVFGTRNAELRSITHRYNANPGLAKEGATSAIQRANARAQAIASALGVTIVGVHRYDEERMEPPSGERHGAPPPAMAVRRRGTGSLAESLGPVSGTERAGVRVTVTYRITGSTQANPPVASG